LFGRWFFKPGFERFLVRFEGQGWFSATSYKQQQGQRVRRGTIIGILALVGAGLWTMQKHKILDRYPANWEIGIPFTGTITDISSGDAVKVLNEKYPGWADKGVPAYEFRDLAAQFSGADYVRIDAVRPDKAQAAKKIGLENGAVYSKKEVKEKF